MIKFSSVKDVSIDDEALEVSGQPLIIKACFFFPSKTGVRLIRPFSNLLLSLLIFICKSTKHKNLYAFEIEAIIRELGIILESKLRPMQFLRICSVWMFKESRRGFASY